MRSDLGVHRRGTLEFGGGDGEQRERARLQTHTHRVTQPTLGDEFRLGYTEGDLLFKQRPPEIFLESAGRVALAPQPALVGILRKCAASLKKFLSLNCARKLLVAHSHAGGNPRSDEDFGVDHPVEHIPTQAGLFVRVDEPGAEKRLELLTATCIEPLEVVVPDFGIVDCRYRHAAVGGHILMNSPECEWNADENHNPPRYPACRVVSNELKHGINLVASRAVALNGHGQRDWSSIGADG